MIKPVTVSEANLLYGNIRQRLFYYLGILFVNSKSWSDCHNINSTTSGKDSHNVSANSILCFLSVEEYYFNQAPRELNTHCSLHFFRVFNEQTHKVWIRVFFTSKVVHKTRWCEHDKLCCLNRFKFQWESIDCRETFSDAETIVCYYVPAGRNLKTLFFLSLLLCIWSGMIWQRPIKALLIGKEFSEKAEISNIKHRKCNQMR